MHIPDQVPPPIPPVHVPDPVQPQIHPAHIPDPVQLQIPPVYVPDPVQLQILSVHVPTPMLPPAPPVQIPHLNWSYFKPECSGKQEDVEAHLLGTNDWMETHNFPEVAKVQRFCLTLTGEARLWYETLRPIVVDWRVTRTL